MEQKLTSKNRLCDLLIEMHRLHNLIDHSSYPGTTNKHITTAIETKRINTKELTKNGLVFFTLNANI